MATTAKTSEAQRIVDELIDNLGMAGAAIAREIGVKADTIQNIKGRRATGNLQVARLRILRDQMLSAAVQRNTAQNHDISSAPLTEQMPQVADLLQPVQDSADPASLTLTGEAPESEPAKTFREKASDFLRDAMLGRVSVEAPSPAKAGKKSSDGKVTPRDVAEQVTPIVASFIVLGVDWLIQDPYKPCAPTDQESYAILFPIVKRLARKVEAQRELTEDDMELLGMALAITAYGRRARGVYKAIHAEEVQRVRSDNRAAAASAFGAGGLSGDAASAPGDAGAGRRVENATGPLPFGRRAGHDGQTVGGAGRGASGGAAADEQRRADASIAQLLQQDAAGRARLGL